MRKFIFFITTFLTVLLMCSNASAEETVKISMNSAVKAAKSISDGYGIEFTLPDLEDNKFLIDSIELAVFERTAGGENFEIYKDENGNESKKLIINNPQSLNIMPTE